MSASSNRSQSNKALGDGVEDKSLARVQDEDKSQPSTGGAPAALDGPTDPALLRASDTGSGDTDKVRVKYVHHVGEKKPGNHATLPVDEANDLITSRVAVLDPL